MTENTCQSCGKPIKPKWSGRKPSLFCSRTCRRDWMKNHKSVEKEWLEQKYLVEGLSTYKIAKLIERDPKTVYEWLKDFGIHLRERTWDTTQDTQPYHDEAWLRAEYIDKQRSTGDIAKQFGVTDANILHFLKVFGIERRTVSEARGIKRWGSPGDKNPQYGKKGILSSNWKGGSTPERQAVYSSIEWADAVKAVWKRDKGKCQRCGVKKVWKNKTVVMHMHHIISFIAPDTRTDPDNLVLLCIDCHHWVHSPKNVNKEFIKE